MDMTFTIKALEKHSAVVTALLDTIQCKYTFTGTVIEDCGTNTHNWFVSHPRNEEAIDIEEELQGLPIPYSTTRHGPHFLPFNHCNFRIDKSGTPKLLQFDQGDNTLDLLNELENAIAGNDYAFVRNFISKKRNQYLLPLDWASQLKFSTDFDFA